MKEETKFKITAIIAIVLIITNIGSIISNITVFTKYCFLSERITSLEYWTKMRIK